MSDAACVTAEETKSPLLFYAGSLGDTELPLSGSFCWGQYYEPEPVDPPQPAPVYVELHNQLEEAMGPTFLIYRNLTGECYPWGGCQITSAIVGTRWLDGLEPGETFSDHIELTAIASDPDEPYELVTPPEWLMAEEASITSVLTDAGLTGDEAEALLDGWRHTFLDLQPDDNIVSLPMGESLAAVSLLPRTYFDDALPITFDPAPRELVRVGLSLQYLDIGCDMPSDS